MRGGLLFYFEALCFVRRKSTRAGETAHRADKTFKGGLGSKVVRKEEVWRAAAVLSGSFHLPNLPFVCV